MKKIYLFFAAFLICSPHLAFSETISLSTYYPAPFGTYDRVRLVPRPDITGNCRVGTLFTRDSDWTLRYCRDVVDDPELGAWGNMISIWDYNPGTQKVFLFDTDAVDNMFVGIGVLDADALLEISQSGDGTLPLLMLNSDDGTDGDLFIVKSDGKVGIGTVGPANNLHIFESRSSADMTMLRLESDAPPNGVVGDRLNILFRMPATGGAQRNVAEISAIHNSPINNRGNIAFSTSITGVLTEQMRIDSAGNVGIGTTTPGRPLEVNGDVEVDRIFMDNGGGVGELQVQFSGGNYYAVYAP